MIEKFMDITQEHYRSFKDAVTLQNERHSLRLSAQIVTGILSSLFIKELSDNAISVMVTSLSILSGFSFSAMFPIAADARKELPTPYYPEDLDDIKRLSHLSSAFRANISYFIIITILCITVLICQMIEFSTQNIHNLITHYAMCEWPSIKLILEVLPFVIDKFLISLSLFLFIEALYTFYRMSTTATDTIRIKEKYKQSHEILQSDEHDT